MGLGRELRLGFLDLRLTQPAFAPIVWGFGLNV